MAANRIIGPALAVMLLGGVGYGIYRSATETRSRHGVNAPVTLRGLVGSEKIDFLSDPQVVAALARHGLTLRVEKSGSREMALRADLKDYDFAFPAGVPAATQIQQLTGAKHSSSPFFTPMAIASWAPIATVLQANGIVRRESQGQYIVDMHKLLGVMAKGTRWRDLSQNAAYPIGKSVLISTTDVTKSNSAAMYLALASYVLNSDNVVESDAEAQKLVPALAPLFLKQGYQESSSAGPFDDYLTMGMGKAPLVLIYEAQFLERELQRGGNGGTTKDMVLLYPQPTIYTKHVLVPLKPAAERLGEALESDTTLQGLAAAYGLRSTAGDPTKHWASRGVTAPAQLLDVIDPPTFQILERMITGIDSVARGGPRAAAAAPASLEGLTRTAVAHPRQRT